MVNVFDVARYILSAIGSKISTMKLQKLCYLLKHGTLPIIEHPCFLKNLRNGIMVRCAESCLNLPAAISVFVKMTFRGEEFSVKEGKALEFILDRYGSLEADELSEMSHREDPWRLAEKNMAIPEKPMEIYYFDQWGKEVNSGEDVI
jgi:uncharacterized phage-associated protein